MMQQISLYLTSIILGIMLFFSFVVAPVTFTALNEENARKFIRKIFPYYYTANLLISFLVLIFFVIQRTFSLKENLAFFITLESLKDLPEYLLDIKLSYIFRIRHTNLIVTSIYIMNFTSHTTSKIA